MKQYLKQDPWRIIEDQWHPDYNRVSESVFSIGNGHMGQRANFEESFSGETLPGSYLAGIYYPDRTRVGWWKIGYPEHFAKVLNAPNWIGIEVKVDGLLLDLAEAEILNFHRELNMQEGYLERRTTVRTSDGKELRIHSVRFCSLTRRELGVIRYSLTPLNFEGTLSITPFLDADIVNQDANYDEKFWTEIETKVKRRTGYVVVETRKTQFQVCTGMKFTVFYDGVELQFKSHRIQREKFVGCTVDLPAQEGKEVVVYKYCTNITSRDHAPTKLQEIAKHQLREAFDIGFDQLLAEQARAWAEKWQESDIRIDGDVTAQQGIRFNIFQLNQTYTGDDPRLNIGPKGFTGEKYGGSTYWDTEAFCFPFYLSTADPHVARNLLIYRYDHLPKAIENARKLGFKDGAALYPMVTMDGTESHNEWEITFEEIHRNGAIAYAIFDYIRYTEDQEYLSTHGLEVLIGIARFWAQRVHWASRKKAYVMHGVTGPNEYENNVNNNWYTNYMAAWCLRYTLESMDKVRAQWPEAYERIRETTQLQAEEEGARWREIAEGMYLHEDPEYQVFVQHETFLDKELLTTDDLDPAERPLNQNWSWDRILRSVFIKQADVLQGLYFFEDHFEPEVLERNFDFYEPRTVHESSLSPCIHSVLAARLGRREKAYEMYLRTARLDLDDYNNDTEDGCHITSMAGTWLAVVKGFGGMRIRNGVLHFDPFLPEQWKGFEFTIRFRGGLLSVQVTESSIELHNRSEQEMELVVHGTDHLLKAESSVKVDGVTD